MSQDDTALAEHMVQIKIVIESYDHEICIYTISLPKSQPECKKTLIACKQV